MSTEQTARMSHIIFQLRRVRTGIEQLLEDIGRAMGVADATAITVDTRDASNDTPLHYAAHCGDVRAIELLAAAGAKLDAHGAFDATPLYCAVSHGHYAAARTLLELGASPEEPTAVGTAAHAAAESHDPRIRALFSEQRQPQP